MHYTTTVLHVGQALYPIGILGVPGTTRSLNKKDSLYINNRLKWRLYLATERYTKRYIRTVSRALILIIQRAAALCMHALELQSRRERE